MKDFNFTRIIATLATTLILGISGWVRMLSASEYFERIPRTQNGCISLEDILYSFAWGNLPQKRPVV